MDDNDEYVVIPQYVYLIKILSAVNSTAAGVVYRGRIVDMSQSDTEGAAIAWDDPGTGGPEVLVGNIGTVRIPTDGSKIVIAFQVADKLACDYNG
jgi:hypothetical protein